MMARAMPVSRETSVLRSVFDQCGPANRQLVGALAAVLVMLIAFSLPDFLTWSPGVDLEIPLQAASRWSTGGEPYLASSFAQTSGPGLPYLYPPWLLPVLVPVASLPQGMVIAVWLAFEALVAVWTCRRLSVPWLAVPVVLLWPPFMEGLVTGNVQVIQFAAFAAIFFAPGRSWELRPRPHAGVEGGVEHDSRPLGRDIFDGVLAAGAGAFKYTQLLPLAWLLRPRPRAAICGVAALATVVTITLLFTGIGLYRDWIDQLERAADPAWAPAGGPLVFLVGRPIATIAAAVAVVAVFFVRGRDAGAWVGIALLVAAPSIHGYGLLFLLPTLLTLRRDLAITLAIFMARYTLYSWWGSIALAAVALAASNRIVGLRAHGPSPDSQPGRVRAFTAEASPRPYGKLPAGQAAVD
jgi:hypothetical protein